jgi:hypothetical protein
VITRCSSALESPEPLPAGAVVRGIHPNTCRQEFHVKAATVISAILLAIGLGIAVRGDLPGNSGMAGPTSEFEPHTHLIAPPAAFQKSAVAQSGLPLTLRGDLK